MGDRDEVRRRWDWRMFASRWLWVARENC